MKCFKPYFIFIFLFISISIYSQNDSTQIVRYDSASAKLTLFEKEYCWFKINTFDKSVSFAGPAFTIDSLCWKAIELAPAWLEQDLIRQFRLLSKNKLDSTFARLILKAPEKIVDEVAFQVANIAYNMLIDTRFRADINVIIRNAQFIYDKVDSLKYVRLVEHGSFESRDYYTSTEYRIRDLNGDTIWSEIPRDIYYWYVVHPKLYHEGVYVKDNTSHIQERTYNYFWRDFLWDNPDKLHDYTIVNKSSSVGKVDTVPRLGKLLQQPALLWDRIESYYLFLRPFTPEDFALDAIGNWASRMLPLVAKDPRPIQPVQISCWHQGNCAEDAYLVAAAARTALIPFITRNTACEDHQFGAIYDNFKNKEWHHYEFFLAGLQNGSKYYGMTNMTPDGNYNFTTSIVEGFRPDGYFENHSAYYAKTCTLNIKITDKSGIPVDGADVIINASPGAMTNTPYPSGHFWTDHTGTLSLVAGAGKVYDFTVNHPVYGKIPSGTSVYGLTQGLESVAGKTYSRTIAYSDKTMPVMNYAVLQSPDTFKYKIILDLKTKEILRGTNPADFKKSNFHFWKDSGSVAVFLCDRANFDKFKAGQAFNAYNMITDFNSGAMESHIPYNGEWYAVISNKTSVNNYEYLEAEGTLMYDPYLYVNDISNSARNFVVDRIEVYDLSGRKLLESNAGLFSLKDYPGINDGIYLIRYNYKNKSYSEKVFIAK